MSKRWQVRKRDGVWVVLDRAGKLRYSCDNHFMALSFALMQPAKPMPFVTFTAADLGQSWNEIMRQIWDKRNEDEE